MKKAHLLTLWLCVTVLALLLPACASTQTTTTSAAVGDEALVAQLVTAGFKSYSPQTAAQREHFQNLPTDKITRVKRGERFFWVYPDAANNQVYVGDRREYDTFRTARRAKTGLDADEDLVQDFVTKRGTPVDVYDGMVPMNALD